MKKKIVEFMILGLIFSGCYSPEEINTAEEMCLCLKQEEDKLISNSDTLIKTTINRCLVELMDQKIDGYLELEENKSKKKIDFMFEFSKNTINYLEMNCDMYSKNKELIINTMNNQQEYKDDPF